MRIAPILLSLLLASPAFAQLESITITSGGRTRTFDLHLPSPLPAGPIPLVVAYHGTGGSSAGMRLLTGLSLLADREGFAVAYPQSLAIAGTVQWNVFVDDQPGHGGLAGADAPDDVLFTRDLVDEVARRTSIDRTRVFATGMSNGGFMSYALAILASDLIAAIAPVAGNLWSDEASLLRLLPASTPRPVLHVHGTADGVVPYPDPDNAPGDYDEYPLFVAARDCGAVTYSETINIAPGVDKLRFCPPPVEVSLVRVTGMGHAWTNGTYETSREIVAFFGLGTTGSVREARSHALAIAPNPVRSRLTYELPEPGVVRLVSPLGRYVFETTDRALRGEIDCRAFPSGIYLMRTELASGAVIATTLLVLH